MHLGNDQLHEACGIFGIWAPNQEVARLTYFGLKALQHRGQESAGIAVGDGTRVLLRKDCGLVSQVLSESDLSALKGSVALGHVRYATAGTRTWMAAQPHLFSADDLTIALAHNGTLVNSDETRRDLISEGVAFRTDSDSEVAAAVIVRASRGKGSLFDGIRHMMRRLRGGYAMAVIDEDSLRLSGPQRHTTARAWRASRRGRQWLDRLERDVRPRYGWGLVRAGDTTRGDSAHIRRWHQQRAGHRRKC